MRSSLATRIASGPSSDAEVRQQCRDAWHRDGVVCLRSDWLPTWADRKQLEILAEKTFGVRRIR